ncbi:hypothetical protein FRB91_008413 [Serendipita sp. 411]|nr:hypothetical protein FRB91_008413 [Serendipita sp. 411]
MTQLQTAVNSFTNACAAAQVPVPPITLVNPLTQQPLLGTGTLPTPGLPLPGAPGAAPLPPGAAVPQPGVPGAGGLSPSETAPFMPQEIRKDVTIKGTHNIPMAPIGQTPGAALPVPGAPVPGVPAPVPGAPVVPGLPIPGQQGQVVQPGTQLLQQPGQVPPVPPVAAAPPVGVPGIQSQRPTRVRRSLPNNPISLLRRLESSSSSSSTTSSATASSPSSPKSNGAGAGMDTRKIVGLTVIGLFVSWVL